MRRFVAGEVQVLVSTTVIEVGVDVPNATVMVVEHAERFGLAQLHQLRGRIGRGSEASTCVLLYDAPWSEESRARLTALAESEDGFALAETDLQIRGPGDVFGTRQSGLPCRWPPPVALVLMAAPRARGARWAAARWASRWPQPACM